MSNQALTLTQKILDATDGGLRIFEDAIQGFNPKRPFKIRANEKTPSTSVKKMQDGTYLIKDFGNTDKPCNAIQYIINSSSDEPKNVILSLADRYGIATNSIPPNFEFLDKKVNDIDWNITTNNQKCQYNIIDKIPQSALNILGSFVTQEVCDSYNLFYLKDYTFLTKSGKIMRKFSTDYYPIFAYVNQNENTGDMWLKIYQPKDKEYRFLHFGERPKDFIFGHDRLPDKQDNNTEEDKSTIDPETNTITWDLTNSEENKKIDFQKIVITSGGRDMLNMASLGYDAVCFNSETATIYPDDYKKLQKKAHIIYYLPDNDATGQRVAKDLAFRYPKLRMISLPNSLSDHKDSKGNPCKDLSDFVKLYKKDASYKVKKIVDYASPLQFWKTDYKKGQAYVSSIYLRNFVSKLGYYRLKDDKEKLGYRFIHIDDKNIIYPSSYQEIRDAILNKLQDMTNPFEYELVENKNALKETALQDIYYYKEAVNPIIKETQDLNFIADKVTVTATDITVSKRTIPTYQDVLLPYDFNIQKSPFTISDDYKNITINIESNDILNYLINTSRVHHQDEKGENRTFAIDGKGLTPAQIQEQKEHLINKIFVFGYLLDQYKDPTKTWVPVASDYDDNDDGAEGGTGKSFFFNLIGNVLNTEIIDGKKKDLFGDNHIFGNVTKRTKLIFFDDTRKDFDFESLYSASTVGIAVNEKYKNKVTIPYKDSAKFSICTNYAFGDMSGSTHRRSLVMAFSSWYHFGAEGRKFTKEHKIIDDFGYRLIDDWNNEQWNDFHNFCVHAIQFYKSCADGVKLGAPFGNIQVKQSKASIGKSVMEFANDYYLDLEDEKYPKHSVEEQKKNILTYFHNEFPMQKGMTAKSLGKKLQQWADIKGYEFNPPDCHNDRQGRILKCVSGKTFEYWIMRKKT